MALSTENVGVIEAELFELRQHVVDVMAVLDEMPDGDRKNKLNADLDGARLRVVEILDGLDNAS